MARRAKNINTLPTIVTKTMTSDVVLSVEPVVTVKKDKENKTVFKTIHNPVMQTLNTTISKKIHLKYYFKGLF